MQSLLKKLSHLWDYYKLPILGIPLLVLFLAYVFVSFSQPEKEAFSVYIINQDISLEDAGALEDALRTSLTSFPASDSVLVEHSLYIDRENADPDSQMVFTASIAAHSVDVMISDTRFLEQYAPMDALLDLTELVPEARLQALSPFLLTASDGNGNSVVYGVDVSSCPFLEDFGFDAPVLTIAKYSEHTEAALELLYLLFGL